MARRHRPDLASDDSEIPPEVVKEGIRLYEEGKRLESCSEYKAAIDYYLESMRITFPDAVTWNDVAGCYLMLAEMERCEEAVRRAIEIDPKNAAALQTYRFESIAVDNHR
jgi:tetratricopeptide (TPR) repeat protein